MTEEKEQRGKPERRLYFKVDPDDPEGDVERMMAFFMEEIRRAKEEERAAGEPEAMGPQPPGPV